MVMRSLTLPEEPRALRSMARTLLDQAPETGLSLIVGGEWITDPLWECWRDLLQEHGMDRERFGQIVADNGNELRLWVVGERPWQQYISGLAGRVDAAVVSVSDVHGERRPPALARRPGPRRRRPRRRNGETHLTHRRAPSPIRRGRTEWARGQVGECKRRLGYRLGRWPSTRPGGSVRGGAIGIILGRAGGGAGAIPAQGPGLSAAICIRLIAPLRFASRAASFLAPLGGFPVKGRRAFAWR